MTIFVFTWCYASIHRWAGQNIYLTSFVFTWHYASIHRWAGQNIERDMAMRRIFWGFWRNQFSIGPLHYISRRSDFGFEFAEIFVIKEQLTDLASWGGADSPTQWAGELPTRQIGEPLTLLFSESASRGVTDSLTQRVGEWLTPRLAESGNRHCESGSLKFKIDFPNFKQLKTIPLKDQFSKK